MTYFPHDTFGGPFAVLLKNSDTSSYETDGGCAAGELHFALHIDINSRNGAGRRYDRRLPRSKGVAVEKIRVYIVALRLNVVNERVFVPTVEQSRLEFNTT